jgi:hypothetical protein
MAEAPGQLSLEAYEARFAPEKLEAIQAHPRFNEALRRSLTAPLRFHADYPRMSMTLKDSGKFYSGLLCMYLHSTGGLTLTRVRAHCAGSGIISPGAAEALLAYMRDLGFVEPAPQQPNRREVRLVVAPPLLAAFHERMRLEVEAAAMLDERMAPLTAAWDRPGVLEAFMAVQVRDLISVTPFVRPGDAAGLVELFAYNAGPLMMMRIMAGGAPGDSFPPVGPMPLSMAGLAVEFDVSRAHVQRFIQAAQGFSFLERLEDEGAVRLLPRLTQAQSYLYACAYAQSQACAAEIMPGLGLV